MSLSLFEVPNDFESRIDALIKAQAYVLRITEERRISDENDVLERRWSVFQQEREVFCFSIAESKNGTFFFIQGRQIEAGHELIIQAILDEVERTGKRIKRGDKTWFA
jgi:hypothetical protein